MQSSGGAAIACQRIGNSLTKYGHEVLSLSSDGVLSQSHNNLFLGKKFKILFSLFSGTLPLALIQKLRNKELQKQLGLFLSSVKPDIINAHNLHSADWPIFLIRTCLNFAPVVWTLHDCWSFLGSYYPTHAQHPSHLLNNDIEKFWKSMERTPLKYPLLAATPSEWMKNEAEKFYWNNYPVETIHNPIPDSFLVNRDRLACKKSLNLNLDKTTILCIAGNLKEARKGGSILQDLLTADWNSGVEFLLIGDGNSSSINADKIKNLGFINDEITVQMAYHAADILLHPAPVDNLPNTVVEAMSCGTPVLAFDTGGLPEIVITGKSGWLCPTINSKEMLHLLKDILDKKTHLNLRNSTYAFASSKFNSTHIGTKYHSYFETCLNNL